RLVFTVATLAPNATATFQDSYTVPLDTCGPYSDTFNARGFNQCNGNAVTATATKSCPGTNTPCIEVTKFCTNAPVSETNITFGGTVRNCGNITLTNVILRDSVALLG